MTELILAWFGIFQKKAQTFSAQLSKGECTITFRLSVLSDKTGMAFKETLTRSPLAIQSL